MRLLVYRMEGPKTFGISIILKGEVGYNYTSASLDLLELYFRELTFLDFHAG